MSHQVSAILCDFANVIAFFDYDKVVRAFVELSGGALSFEQTKEALFGESILKKIEVGEMPTPDFIAYIRRQLQLPTTPEQAIIDAWNCLFTPNEAVIEVLHRIPGTVPLVLASTTNELHYEYFRSAYADTFALFSDFVTSFSVGAIKPDPAFYEACVQTAKVPANQCLYIDDIPEYIEAAKQLGIDGIAYTSTTNLAAELQQRGVDL